MKKLGLIAGNRKFPLLAAQAARRRGYSVITIAIKRDTSPAIKRFSDKVYWLGLDEFSRMFDILRDEGVSDVVMAGQVSPHRLFSLEVRKDPLLNELLNDAHNKKADTLFLSVAGELQKRGLKLLDSTFLLKEFLPDPGIMTRIRPDETIREDIFFGFGLAKSVGALDIGQTVAVKDKAIVAVEAFEGTDNLIRRAGRLARGGITVVKVSKPAQDMRFDVPVVGLNTVKSLINARGRCLAIEAGTTIFIDAQKSRELADKKGIVIAAVGGDGSLPSE